MKLCNCLKTIALSAIAIVGLSACDHKDLCYVHPHTAPVKVEFDWRHNAGVVPASMSVYAYPDDGGEVLRFDLNGRNGGEIVLPLGKYDFVCVNPTSEIVNYRGHDYLHTFEAYTGKSNPLEHLGRTSDSETPRADGTENEAVLRAPDVMWHHILRDLRFDDPQKAHKVVMTPEDLLCNYTVDIRNVDNLKYVQSACATLSGMAGSLYLNNSIFGDDVATVPFAANINGESSLSAAFRVFGHCPEDVRHKLMVYTVLADGSAYYSQVDVTDQVHNAPDKRNVHITIDGLKLPKPMVSGDGGFRPSVTDWDEIDIELEM